MRHVPFTIKYGEEVGSMDTESLNREELLDASKGKLDFSYFQKKQYKEMVHDLETYNRLDDSYTAKARMLRENLQRKRYGMIRMNDIKIEPFLSSFQSEMDKLDIMASVECPESYEGERYFVGISFAMTPSILKGDTAYPDQNAPAARENLSKLSYEDFKGVLASRFQNCIATRLSLDDLPPYIQKALVHDTGAMKKQMQAKAQKTAGKSMTR